MGDVSHQLWGRAETSIFRQVIFDPFLLMHGSWPLATTAFVARGNVRGNSTGGHQGLGTSVADGASHKLYDGHSWPAPKLNVNVKFVFHCCTALVPMQCLVSAV